jgi:hypothetical protein
MRRIALALPLLLASSAFAHDRFDPVANLDGRLTNPYGRGFRGAEGQGLLSGLYRPYVLDGPSTYRSSAYPFPPAHQPVRQTIHIFHRRWP